MRRKGGYKPGQNVIAKIAKPESGGYAVIIVKDNLPGYLPSNARHQVGDDVLATYVCFDKNRVLLSELSGFDGPGGAGVCAEIPPTNPLGEISVALELPNGSKSEDQSS